MEILKKLFIKIFGKIGTFYYIIFMGKTKDLTGKKFGYLSVVSKHRINGQLKWKTVCVCGNERYHFTYDLTSGKVKSCSCKRGEFCKINNTGENNPRWKGGLPMINSRGYKEFRHGELRGVLEHRYVYEQHYGIKLLPHQNIHHVNGDKLDNRIENLELWDTSQPQGQRVEEKIMFYKELYEKYKDHPKYKNIF